MAAGAAAIAALALLSIAYGSTVIALSDVIAALGHAAGLDGDLVPGSVGNIPVAKIPVAKIVVDLRLPRTIMAICVGAGLGVIGALLQTVTRNDLADPFLFGLSSGAAAGAVPSSPFLATVSASGRCRLPPFTGGILAAGIVLLLVSRVRGQGPERLILAGLAVSFMFIALTNYLVFAGDQRAAHSVLFWTMGGLGLARWDNVGLAALGACTILAYGLWNHRKLDAFLAGENAAESLGVPAVRMRRTAFLVAAFSTAILVSVAGVIGFVGLMIPHLSRPLAGPLHLRLIASCALFGAVLLLASDLLARTLLPPQELPIGIITSSVGAFFVVTMLIRNRS